MKLIKYIITLVVFMGIAGAEPANSFLLPGFLNSPVVKLKCDQVIIKERFSICYSYDNQIPLLAFYKLTSDDVIAPIQPREYLRASKDIPYKFRPSYAAYKKSYWDAGHLPAAASVDVSPSAADDIYMVSWCAPQNPNLNRTVWKYIEREERRLALISGEVFIITGVIPNKSNVLIKDRLNIPLYYFKLIIIPSTNTAIAYKAANVSEEHRPGNNIHLYETDVAELIKNTKIKLLNFGNFSSL